MDAIFSFLENRIVYCTKFVINLAGTILCGLPVALLDIYAIFSEIVRNLHALMDDFRQQSCQYYLRLKLENAY